MSLSPQLSQYLLVWHWYSLKKRVESRDFVFLSRKYCHTWFWLHRGLGERLGINWIFSVNRHCVHFLTPRTTTAHTFSFQSSLTTSSWCIHLNTILSPSLFVHLDCTTTSWLRDSTAAVAHNSNPSRSEVSVFQRFLDHRWTTLVYAVTWNGCFALTQTFQNIDCWSFVHRSWDQATYYSSPPATTTRITTALSSLAKSARSGQTAGMAPQTVSRPHDVRY